MCAAEEQMLVVRPVVDKKEDFLGEGGSVGVAQVLVELLVELDVRVGVQVEDPVAPVDGVDVVDVLEPPGPELGDEEGLDLIHRGLLEDPAEVDQAVEPLDV